MRKRLIIIHGYKDNPTFGWMSWLNTEATKLGYKVLAPQMPTAKIPDIQEWVTKVATTIQYLDDQTVLLAHSLGTFIILRYLSEYNGPDTEKAGKLILVSGFLKPSRAGADKFFKPKPDLANVRKRVETIVSIYSDNDKLVSPVESIELAKKLKSQKICLKGQGHFLNKNTSEIPELINLLTS